jgi:hypothetical protein
MLRFLKIVSPKDLAKKMSFFTPITAKNNHNIGGQVTRQFFRQKL